MNFLKFARDHNPKLGLGLLSTIGNVTLPQNRAMSDQQIIKYFVDFGKRLIANDLQDISWVFLLGKFKDWLRGTELRGQRDETAPSA